LLGISDGIFEFIRRKKLLTVNGIVIVFLQVERTGLQMNKVIILLIPSLTGK
jgi:hypothetical protein